MNNLRCTKRQSLWLALSLGGLLVLGGSALAASDSPAPGSRAGDTMSREASADTVKPGVPNRSEIVDSAYKKLDPSGKGYVAKSDTTALEGFDRFFDQVDTQHTGKLSYSQFKEAWKRYAAEDSPTPPKGKAAY